MQQGNVIVVGDAGALVLDKATLREIRGSFWNMLDSRFTIIMLLSIILHGICIYKINSIELKEVNITVIEKMPERFARLIIEKPIEKEKPEQKVSDKAISEKDIIEETEKVIPKTAKEKKTIERKAAKRAVASRAARVEKKIRTVGVLGMLTGRGSTAKGLSVVDVLGANNRKKERFQDLEKALENMSGLKQTSNLDVMSRKLVRSKDVSVSHKENIDDLVASIGAAKTTALTKRGDFILQKPESIEGAASSSAKRVNSAINKVVASHKTSIRMSYEKYLKRIPDLAGKVTVRFTISATGRVTIVQILENTTACKELERDIVRKVKMWRFEAIPEGDVTVTYPFLFRSS